MKTSGPRLSHYLLPSSVTQCLRGAKVLFLAFCLSIAALSQETGTLVQGAVVNSVNGRQIPRAVVVLRDSQGNGTVGRADDIGRFRLKNVAPGLYFVSAERPGFYAETSKLRRQTIDVPKIGAMPDLLVKLTPQADIIGRVTDEHSDALQHAEIILLGWEYHNGRRVLAKKGSAFTNDLGEYRVFPLPAGKYFVMVSYDARTEWRNMLRNLTNIDSQPVDMASPPVFYPGTTDFREAAPVAVKPGDEFVTDFTVASKPAVTIRGKVVNGLTGLPVPRPPVQAGWTPVPGTVEPAVAKSTDNGDFEITGLAPGFFTLSSSSSDDKMPFYGELSLEVGGLGAEGVQLAVLPDFTVPGHVRIEGADKNAIRRVSFEFIVASGQTVGSLRLSAAAPDFKGLVRLHAERHYNLRAVDLPGDAWLKSVSVSGQDTSLNDVVISAGSSEIEFVIDTNGGHVDGAALTSHNEPVRDCLIMLIPDVETIDPVAIRYTRSDIQGRFTVRGVPPGNYRLLAWEEANPDELLADPVALKSWAAQGDALKVEESGHYTVIPKIIPAEPVP